MTFLRKYYFNHSSTSGGRRFRNIVLCQKKCSVIFSKNMKNKKKFWRSQIIQLEKFDNNKITHLGRGLVISSI